MEGDTGYLGKQRMEDFPDTVSSNYSSGLWELSFLFPRRYVGGSGIRIMRWEPSLTGPCEPFSHHRNEPNLGVFLNFTEILILDDGINELLSVWIFLLFFKYSISLLFVDE